MAFDLASVLADVSDSGTGREQIEYIRLDLIDSDPNNFYQLSEVDKLADNISLCGLQQPIRVRQQTDPDKSGRYMIVSGHRRRAAIELLAKDTPDRWQEVPCIVERDAVSPALQQLRLIYANSDTRKISSADLMEQAAQVEKLLYQLKEEGYEFPGRMRDHVAEAVKASKTKLARLKVIRDKLVGTWMCCFRIGAINESVAHTLAQLPAEQQKILYMIYGESASAVFQSTIESAGSRMQVVADLKSVEHGCPDGCAHVEMMMEKNARDYYSRCETCCFECSELRTCKNSCPKAFNRKAELKEEKKAIDQADAAAQAAKDRPAIEFIQGVYERVGELRKMNHVAVRDLYAAQRRMFASSDEEKQKALENGTAKISTNTTLPFGYSFYHSEAKNLCAVANVLKCSIDYLLGRTDVKEMAQSGTPVSEVGTIWHPISEEPPTGVDLIWVDYNGYSDTAKYMGFQEISIASTISWGEARYWAYPPGYLVEE